MCYVENGKYSTNTALVQYNSDWYYVSNGTIHPNLSGEVTVDYTTYYLKNGILTNCHINGHSTGPDSRCTRCDVPVYFNADVTIKVWVPTEDLFGCNWLTEMQKRFEAEYPEYNITWINECVSEGDISYAVSTDPQGVADVYMYTSDQMNTLQNFDCLSPLGGDFAQQIRNDNAEALVNSATWTDGYLYGFPVSGNTWFMYYNKDVFTEEDVKSLDTMLAKGRVGFPMDNGWYNGAFFLGCGGTLFGENGIDAAAGIQFGGQSGYTAAKKMIELSQHPNFYVASNAFWMMDNMVDAMFSGTWDYAGLKQTLGDSLGIAMLPTFSVDGEEYQMTALCGSKLVGVNPYAENLELSTKFAAFLASKEAQLARYEMRNVIPSHRELRNHTLIQKNALAVAQMDTIEYASVAQPSISEMANYWSPMGNFANQIYNGDIGLYNYKEEVDRLVELLNASSQ